MPGLNGSQKRSHLFFRQKSRVRSSGGKMNKLQLNKKIIRDFIKVSRRISERGLTAGVGGGISLRIPKSDTILIKGYDLASGQFVACEDLIEKNISVLDIYGKQRNRVKPCLETPLHLEVLKARKNIGAVIHAHAPYATAFGNMKSKLKEKALEGNIKLHESLEKAVLAPHAKSGSQELARIVAEPFQRDDVHCVLMEGHGVTVVGADIYRAYYHLDALEGRAKTFILTMLLYNGIR
jgi:L-fuculose-phosphate aldolase